MRPRTRKVLILKTVEIVTLIATLLTAGWVSAFLTQLIKRESWPSSAKLILSMVLAALVGLAAAWLSGDVTHFVTLWKSGTLTATEVLTFGALVFASAQVWYHQFWSAPGQLWAQKLGAFPK